ncbi:sushi, von Willebrand factor type A, EGF and pentraxin domain-containing protein 1-like [Gigantopelta aegis]|uniref:sushi, von Willebrand factor type A, EGF and pentraxin domain-containing protein 1-like n=1 Tax=Gigantopelta aegis TaxID=1735272 RepID=UPI001B887F08|nr:sushi, von Willebrand factor type A, EGF and pentraxin domain-containing protein 1-like [Gigantopelta aegis]
MVGGNAGLRVCIEGGAWFVHLVNGTPPVCEPVSCGASPVLQNYVPSQSVGYYGDQVTYSCPDKTVRIGGGGSKHLCNTSGLWEADTLDTSPLCKETEMLFRNSGSEMSGVAPLNTSSGRSSVDCARQCALMDSCHGYTFTRDSMMCSFNTAEAIPVTTKMKAI